MRISQKLSNFYAKKEILLENSLEQFVENVLYFPQIGIELEFYLLDKNSQCLENQGLIADYISSLSQIFAEDSKIYKIEKEQGASQIEIKIAPHSNLTSLAKKIEKIKEEAKNLAQKNDCIACFEAQPFIEDCGSALQFNFSLHDVDGSNVFAKEIEKFSEQNQNIPNRKFMQYSIAGMLNSIDWAMVFYAPEEKDYLRFNKKINQELHKKGKFTAPVNISFGEDNRTAAIRIVRAKNSHNNFFAKEANCGEYRIEFRVPSANSDPFLAMTSLLIAISHSFVNKEIPQDSQKVFGNAFDDKYSFKKFAKNLQIAEENFFSNSF